MSFDSPVYFLFLTAVCLGQRACPREGRWALLLAASLFFYACFSPPLTLLIVGVILLAYLAGRVIGDNQNPVLRRLALWGTVLGCMGLLFYFKYFNFVMEAVSHLADGRWTFREILLPVGCSFYTFQALSYVIDVYRGSLLFERHLGYLALYISFFPQLVAGPIERAGALLPQLRKGDTAGRADIAPGMKLLLSGLFRKLVLADLAAPTVDRIFAHPRPDGAAVALGTVLFALQIYSDFAGYSEIARGSALLLGVRLRRNFDRPYLASSPRGFWRRWHMSLTAWFTDYVYIPLGGSRHGRSRQCLATLAVFLLSGLWHGADWTFVLWGLWHGLLCVGEILLCPAGAREKERRKGLKRLLTWVMILPSWVLFRAQNLPQALSLYGCLLSQWHGSLALGQTGLTPVGICCLLLGAAQLPMLNRLGEGKRFPLIQCGYLIAAVVLAWLLQAGTTGQNAFIYFQF